jgi:hypothetical protein
MNYISKIQSTSENNAYYKKHGLTSCCVIIMMFILTACATKSPSEVWPHTSRNGLWSREEIARSLLENAKIEGKSRTEVIQILGPPDLSEKKIAQEKEHETRNDTYQLSFFNTTSLDIEYDAKDTALRYSFGPGCLANYFPGTEANGSSKVKGPEAKNIDYSIRKQITSDLLKIKEEELEHLWGPPDLSEVDIVPTFPTPLRSSYYSWRLTPDGRVYNLAETDGAFNIPPARRQILELVTITLGPDCPVRRPAEPGIK